MRHVDHGDPARAQSAQRGEQPRHLIRGQAGGGFVEHQDFSLGGERPGDRDKGFLGSAQALDPERVIVGEEIMTTLTIASKNYGSWSPAGVPRSNRSGRGGAENRG